MRSPECHGIWGKLFGHKFSTWDRYCGFCQRCGLRPGGISKVGNGRLCKGSRCGIRTTEVNSDGLCQDCASPPFS